MKNKSEYEAALAHDIAQFIHDPYGFVMFAFAWNEGELKGKHGPRDWQKKFLMDLGDALSRGEINNFDAIQRAVASGHGTGKSGLVSWLILWAMSTMVDTKGVVTANTENQLKTKTWAELNKWYRLLINKDWFELTATALHSKLPDHEKTWRIDQITWSLTNTEAFAGLHNEGKRILIVFDEASAIPDMIWEVTEGALTDSNTEIIWATFGNPTRNTGRFRQCFGSLKHRWGTNQIDSRSVDGTNKTQIQKWVDDYGEDSDFVKVRVRGAFPSASSLQLIGSDIVGEAMRRPIPHTRGDALIMTLDIARGGADNCVFWFRRGFDARSIEPVKIPGSEVRDSMRLVAIATDLLDKYKPDQFFYDGTGVGGPVGDRIRQMGYRVTEVQFGAASPDPKLANFRAYMWVKMRDWIQAGGCLPVDNDLETDLTSVEYFHNRSDQLLLEPKDAMKKRGLASPDAGDSLALSFSYPVAPVFGPGSKRGKIISEYNPFG